MIDNDFLLNKGQLPTKTEAKRNQLNRRIDTKETSWDRFNGDKDSQTLMQVIMYSTIDDRRNLMHLLVFHRRGQNRMQVL